MRQRITLALLVLLTTAAAAARDYDFRLFTYDEVNHLRQSSLLERMKIFGKVLDRYGSDLQHAVQMRNYQRMASLADNLDQVLDYVLEDVRLCTQDEKLRNNKHLRKSEIGLREMATLLRGLQRAVPSAWQGKIDAPMRKLIYGRRQLFNFINRVNEEE
jgi:hypothetical protein